MVTSHHAPSPQPRHTSLSAYLTIDYAVLCELFGAPVIQTDGYKTDAEWHVSINEHFVTIYNYKNGPAYGVETTLHQIDQWHVGGRDVAGARALHEWLRDDARVHQMELA